jgi:hypothetical protein
VVQKEPEREHARRTFLHWVLGSVAHYVVFEIHRGCGFPALPEAASKTPPLKDPLPKLVRFDARLIDESGSANRTRSS